MMRVRGFLTAVATATMAGAGPVLAQPAGERGVTPTTLLFGIEEQANSFPTDEENLCFRLAFQEANTGGPFTGAPSPERLPAHGR